MKVKEILRKLFKKKLPELKKYVNQTCYDKYGRFLGWFSRSIAAAIFIYCKDQDGDWCVLGSERGEEAADYRGFWNCTCGYLDFNETTKEAALRELYEEALSHPSVVGIVIGTRPDCVDEEKLDYLADLAHGRVLSHWRRSLAGEPDRTSPIVIVEYGIESCYDEVLQRINRGHDFETARRAVCMTAERGLDVGAHFILGLPGETRQMMLDSCSLINALPLRSVKFHQLQIVKGTRMEKEYAECPQDFERFSLDEYLDFFVDMLERLRPSLSIERFAGEVPPRFVNDTPWGLIRNVELLRLLDRHLESRETWQGRLL
jgi:radical SAM protein (TIGR01212 family)